MAGMKLESSTLRTFTALHTWMGLVAGFALFVAFYAGALTVFHHELQHWQSTQATVPPRQTLDDAQRLLDETLKRHPAARQHVGMLFPDAESDQAVIYWQDEHATWRFATLGTLEGSAQPPQTSLSELVNRLHYSLGIPLAGTYLMGIVSLLYGMALVSGLVIYLPQLSKDLFALRPGQNLKRFWKDAHNVVGVFSLPLHLMFAITGALLCLSFVLMLALDPLIYGGKLMPALPAAMDTAPPKTAIGEPSSMDSLAIWHARSIETAREYGVASFKPIYLKLANAGDVNAVVEITGESPRTLGPLGSVALDANTGRVLATQLPGARDANHATLAAAYALHFGEYGPPLVRWLYFVLGLGGAFLFYSGNLLWIESRRKRRQAQQGLAQIVMARATVGICIGLCVAVSSAFVATQVLQAVTDLADMDIAAGIQWACFLVWGICVLWAFIRPPIHAARELLWLAAALTVLIPVAHGIGTGWWLWKSAAAGHWSLFGVDAVALALASGFAVLAHVATRRARMGDPNSVWALATP